MPTDKMKELWQAVERELGEAVPRSVRQFVTENHDLELELREQEQAVELVVMTINSLQKHGMMPSKGEKRERGANVEIPDGERWQLLYDIGRRFERKYKGMPLTVEYRGFAPMTLEHFTDNRSYPPSQRIRVVFDSGMNLATVFALLKREFQLTYRPKGWVRTTRPLGKRAIALVRFVCLESAEGLTWRERLALWNERYPDWAFPDARRLQAAFRRAELQLTGSRGALDLMHITLQEWERRDRKWREDLLDHIQAEEHLHEEMLEEAEEEL
jgi:hypothetical protein